MSSKSDALIVTEGDWRAHAAGVANLAIKAKQPPQDWGLSLPPKPYPGLRPFNKSEWPIFFGRERMVSDVTSRLIQRRLLMVHGDSGCGKSSLMRAGVLPRLELEAERESTLWVTFEATPGEAPLLRLARALSRATNATEGDDLELEFRRALNRGRDGIQRVTELLTAEEASSSRFFILIDQFEELFACARKGGRDEAASLIDFLIGLSQRPIGSLHAVLTMRSDFLGACAQFPGFAEAVNESQYLVPRMEHADLVRAIREPATLYDGQVDLDLTELLISDAYGVQDQLPLIQHALLLLHRQQPQASSHGPWRLRRSTYRELAPGLGRLLSDSADRAQEEAEAALAASGAADCKRLVEDLFRCLTDVTGDGQAIRRPQTLSELARATGKSSATVRLALDAFRKDGVSLVRPYGPEALAEDTLIDFSHEALIRCWSKLAAPIEGWPTKEFKNGLVWRSLLVQAESFERDSNNVLSPSTTLERSKWLLRRNAHWCERYGGGWEGVVKLVNASRRARLRTQRTWWLFACLLVLAGLWAALIWARSTQREAQAQREKTQAQVEMARAQAENAQAQKERAEAKAEAERLKAEQEIRWAKDAMRDAEQVAASILPNVADAQLRTQLEKQLSSITKEASSGQIPPRAYVYFPQERQRSDVQAFAAQAGSLTLGTEQLEIRVVQLKPQSDGTLRCFSEADCAEARTLIATLNDRLNAHLRLVDYSSTSVAKNLRPRHYEVWLGSDFATNDPKPRTTANPTLPSLKDNPALGSSTTVDRFGPKRITND